MEKHTTAMVGNEDGRFSSLDSEMIIEDKIKCTILPPPSHLRLLPPTTTSVKQLIDIVTTTESFEWSSLNGVAAPSLKIPKIEKFE
ncbi:unnamed protein product [Lactuca virosa]|uniref:Uncharacterized protein n=1 Tax=Lactuca virosa TaxID=75947 RepID=A0AAU9PT89_9ASTR|nr:unnamed protein product [Lactuca virosa]